MPTLTLTASAKDDGERTVQAYYDQFQAVLGIYLTNKCNIMCRHCCVSSGPRESTRLNVEDVLDQVPVLVRQGLIRAIHVSGGEPFLYRDDLVKIAAVGKQVGIPVGVNTNAFWATQREKSNRVLCALSGVTQILISADVYHEEFLPVDRVINAAAAAIDQDMAVHIGICTPEGKSTPFVDRLMLMLGDELLEKVSIGVTPVELGGRANQLPEAYWRGRGTSMPEGACGLLNRPVVLEDGDVIACCNTTAAQTCFASPLILGNVKSESLRDILGRSNTSYLIQAMRVLGPKFIAERLEPAQAVLLQKDYVVGDICSLCMDIMSQPEIASAATRVANSPDVRRLIACARAVALGEPAMLMSNEPGKCSMSQA